MSEVVTVEVCCNSRSMSSCNSRSMSGCNSRSMSGCKVEV